MFPSLLPFRKRSRLWRRLFVEPLEDRVVPATVNFINPAGGDWGDFGQLEHREVARKWR